MVCQVRFPHDGSVQPELLPPQALEELALWARTTLLSAEPAGHFQSWRNGQCVLNGHLNLHGDLGALGVGRRLDCWTRQMISLAQKFPCLKQKKVFFFN